MTKKEKSVNQSARAIIRVTGVVQGVGFRPFIYRLATGRGLTGRVINTSGGVEIDVEGPAGMIDGMESAIRQTAPPNCRITGLEQAAAPPAGYTSFEIGRSDGNSQGWQHVSPDSCTCNDCLEELFAPADRRYRYPFINCTNCGPRFTIIEDLPYDRPLTTMRRFEMCSDCRSEYEDPADRRFHAEPNACPACGPRLWLADQRGADLDAVDPIQEAAAALAASAIVAIKGLGGFQLVCLAQDINAVERLRERKRRPQKPFAVMVENADDAAAFCQITPRERELLESVERPIVLLEMNGTVMMPGIAPGLGRLGVMLPCAPLHFLLMDAVGEPLVMTSGNLSEEPICRTNGEAVSRLAGIADYFLFHDRRIISTYDDSVIMVAGGRALPLRRARGYAPLPVELGTAAPAENAVLATGGQLKNTFCLIRGRDAFISQHIGDLEDAETLLHYERTIELYERLFQVYPEIIACDFHPEYLASAYARERTRMPVQVQHHRAHIAACLAENRFPDAVVGVSFDGTGLGDDGAVWGGEFFLGSLKDGLERMAHIGYMPLPGSDAAVREPWRTALGAVWQHVPDRFDEAARLMQVPGDRSASLRRQLEAQLNCPPTSSCGRLFDAMAALIMGVRQISYEAQAAMELEALALAAYGGGVAIEPFPFHLDTGAYPYILSPAGAVAAALSGGLSGSDPGVLAAGFHLGLSRAIVKTCRTIAKSNGLETVALSGGVFQNRLLLEMVMDGLEQKGLYVLSHVQVPPNDGGLSLGQAVLALYQSRT